jgi:hypothetical protein
MPNDLNERNPVKDVPVNGRSGQGLRTTARSNWKTLVILLSKRKFAYGPCAKFLPIIMTFYVSGESPFTTVSKTNVEPQKIGT